MRVSTVAIRTVSCWPTPRWSSTLWNDVQSEKIHFKLYSLGECADRISTNYFGWNCPSVNRVRTSFVEIQFPCKLFRKNRIFKKELNLNSINPLELNRLKQQAASENYLVRQIRLNLGQKPTKVIKWTLVLVGKECYWSCEFQLHGRQKNTRRSTSAWGDSEGQR